MARPLREKLFCGLPHFRSSLCTFFNLTFKRELTNVTFISFFLHICNFLGNTMRFRFVYRTADISALSRSWECAEIYISCSIHKCNWHSRYSENRQIIIFFLKHFFLGIKLMNVERLLKTSPQSWCWNVLISEKRGLWPESGKSEDKKRPANYASCYVNKEFYKTYNQKSKQ